MIMMRLQRIGRKNDPSFRVVVTDSRNSTKTGRHIDILGSYNPKMSTFTIDEEKAKHWISKGVQPSDTLHNLLISHKIIDGKKRNVLSRKSPIVNEEKLKAEAEAKVKKDAEALATNVVSETPTNEVSPVVEDVAVVEEAK